MNSKEETYEGPERRRDDVYIKQIARETAKETLKHMLTMLGMDPNKPHEAQADFVFLRKFRKSTEETKSMSKRAAIVLFFGAIASLLIMGVEEWATSLIESIKSKGGS